MAADALWDKTLLVMNGDEAPNGATTGFKDGSYYRRYSLARTFTQYGTAGFSSAQSAYGTTSYYFPGTNLHGMMLIQSSIGGYMGLFSGGVNTQFGASDFCIELWVYPTAVGTSVSGTKDTMLFTIGVVSATPRFMLIASTDLAGTTGTTFGRLTFTFANGSYAETSIHLACALTLNQWHFLTIDRIAGVITFRKNGVALGEYTTGVTTFSVVSMGNPGNTMPIAIGALTTSPGPSYCLPGYVNGMRLTAASRYAADFTPLTPPAAVPWPYGKYEVVGTVADAAAAPLVRTVRFHRRDTGLLVDSVDSKADGTFKCGFLTNDELTVVCMDNVTSPTENDLALRAVPA